MKKSISLLLSILLIFSLFIVPSAADATYTASDGPLLVSASTTLKSQIALNIYVALPDEVLADEAAYAQFTLNGTATKQYVSEVKGRPETVFEQKVYRFSLDIAPKYMFQKVNFKMFGTVNGSVAALALHSASTDYSSSGFDYSIADYLNERLDKSTDSKMKSLARAMLDYGKAAADYFGVTTSSGIEFSQELADLNTSVLDRYRFLLKTANSPAGYNGPGMSITIDSDVAINIYFIFASGTDVSTYDIKIDGEKPTLVNTSSGYCATISGIVARDFGKLITLSVGKDGVVSEATICVLSYSYSLIYSTNHTVTEKEINLAKALYLYYFYTKDYFVGEYTSPYSGLHYEQIDFVTSEAELEQIDAILNNIITTEMSTIEKILTVHDWMVCNIKYNYDNINDPANQYIESALNGCTVCAGYAKLFYAFMVEIGVPCKYITGKAYTSSNPSGENHAWDAIQMDDGNWYYVDVTWDDPGLNGHSDYPNGENLRYKYFIVPASEIGKDHTPEVTLPTPEGTDMSYNNAAIVVKLTQIKAKVDSGELENTAVLLNFDAEYDQLIDTLKSEIIADAAGERSGVVYTVYAINDSLDAQGLLNKIWGDVGQFAANTYYSSVSVDILQFADLPLTLGFRIYPEE